MVRVVAGMMVIVLDRGEAGDQIREMGGIGSTRIGQAMVIQVASHTHTITTHHHHHHGGTEVAGVVPGNRGLEDVITGTVVNNSEDTVGDTMGATEDIRYIQSD